MALEKKGDGGGEIVHVAAAGVVNITPGEEMNVRRLEADVPLNLPVQIHIECSSDVAGSVAERGNLDESRHGIHGIVARVPPKRTRASINRNLWQGMHGQVRSEEHTSELQSLTNLVCRLLLEKKKYATNNRRILV